MFGNAIIQLIVGIAIASTALAAPPVPRGSPFRIVVEDCKFSPVVDGAIQRLSDQAFKIFQGQGTDDPVSLSRAFTATIGGLPVIGIGVDSARSRGNFSVEFRASPQALRAALIRSGYRFKKDGTLVGSSDYVMMSVEDTSTRGIVKSMLLCSMD